mgnify:CR=1 FL=1
MRKKIPFFIIFFAMIIFFLIPFHSSDIYLRFYLDDPEAIQPYDFYLYYATESSDFNPDQMIKASYDETRGIITFRLDSSLEGHITGLRMDFPSERQLVIIKDITVSSAGIVKKEYNPCFFFADGNIVFRNGIYAVDLITAKSSTVIGTTPDDPFLVFSDDLNRRIISRFSHYYLTKFLICLFVAGCCYFYVKRKIYFEE